MSFLLGEGLWQLATDMARIADVKKLEVTNNANAASLAEFLATDDTFTSLDVMADGDSTRLIVGALRSNPG